MTFRTEDQVRNQAGITLGRKNSVYYLNITINEIFD